MAKVVVAVNKMKTNPSDVDVRLLRQWEGLKASLQSMSQDREFHLALTDFSAFVALTAEKATKASTNDLLPQIRSSLLAAMDVKEDDGDQNKARETKLREANDLIQRLQLLSATRNENESPEKRFAKTARTWHDMVNSVSQWGENSGVNQSAILENMSAPTTKKESQAFSAMKSWRAAASSGLTFTQLWDVIFHDDNLDATQSTELKGKIETIWNEMDTCLHANAPYVSTMIFFYVVF